MRAVPNNRLSFYQTVFLSFSLVFSVQATPANKSSLEKHYEQFLPGSLNRCNTCHQPSAVKAPESLEEFPHNPFGEHLRQLGAKLREEGKPRNLETRLKLLAGEDSDGDKVPNETEILLGHNPGEASDFPSVTELNGFANLQNRFQEFLTSYRWRPFDRLTEVPLPKVNGSGWSRNPIDVLVMAEREKRKLSHQKEAKKTVLLRRVYLDLIGLVPTPEELAAFDADEVPDAFDKVVDRLLEDQRYGERWGRHFMDIWRYSDWGGWGEQVRDSQPHIWKWRDWIIESLNNDKGYDSMIAEMLAADELPATVKPDIRAVGFLARNYKLLSREQWLEDSVKHTAQAFMGITVGCAKCHDHMTDPVSQSDYYRFRAIFEPHQVRIDQVPGELDRKKDGLVRVYDAETNHLTYFFVRGDERKADTNRVMKPGVPAALGGNLGGELEVQPVEIATEAAFPEKRDFVIEGILRDSSKLMSEAREKLKETNSAQTRELKLELNAAMARHQSLEAVLAAEKLEDQWQKGSASWTEKAREARLAQKSLVVSEAELKMHKAGISAGAAAEKCNEARLKLEENELSQKSGGADSSTNSSKAVEALAKLEKEFNSATNKLSEAQVALVRAEIDFLSGSGTDYKGREIVNYPARSTGRRLALARWLTHPDHPLTARVAVNHLWLRHFGRGIITTPENFGRSGNPPSHPALLDWMAKELVSNQWSLKKMHRLILTSSTYRMASNTDAASSTIDPDNIYLWRMPQRRMEAEIVRDNILHVAGSLDTQIGGPEIDHNQGLTSLRRSIYLRVAPEKEVEFLKVFDGPGVTECYQRHSTVMPQQSLALINSPITLNESKRLASRLTRECGEDSKLVMDRAFRKILGRFPTEEEKEICLKFLSEPRSASAQIASTESKFPIPAVGSEPGLLPEKRARSLEHLILVLFNHNEFVTIR